MRAAFIAFGTVGDVLPCLALAARFQASAPLPATVTFVTHTAHQELVAEPARRCGLQLRLVPSQPARVWQGGSSSQEQERPHKRKQPGSGDPGRSLFDPELEEEQREACIAACEDALGRAVPSDEQAWGQWQAVTSDNDCRAPAPLGSAAQVHGTPSPTAAPPAPAAPAGPTAGPLPPAPALAPPPPPAPSPPPPEAGARAEAGGEAEASIIVFNLFALEGFHIAEALGVPCCAVSPCLPPATLPPAFERGFQRWQPALYHRLLQAQQQQQQEDGAGAAEEGGVSWADVKHWMWPLFTERWGPWRCHRLGLPEVPCSSCRSPGQPLPPPPRLLYGLSELLIQQPGHWPDAVHLCGFWYSRDCFPAAQQELPGPLRELAQTPSHEQRQERQPQPVCVDFGSMGRLGLIRQPALLAATLAAAARQLQRTFVVLTGGWQPLIAACHQQQEQHEQESQESGETWQQQQQEGQQAQDEVGRQQQQQRQQQEAHRQGRQHWLYVLTEPISHDALLPHCAGLLHHGGAGTLAAALRHGVPQLVCPALLQFDQQQNAERVGWGGWGTRLATQVLFPDQAGPPAGGGGGCGSAAPAAAFLTAEGGASSGSRYAADCGRVSGGASQAGPSPQHPDPLLVAAGAASLAAALAALLGDASIKAACQQAAQQLAAEDGVGRAVGIILEQGAPSFTPGQGQVVAVRAGSAGTPNTAGDTAERSPLETAAAAAAPATATAERRLPAPRPAHVQRLVLPNGLAISCISPSEALFIYREIFESSCYARHGISLRPGATVVDVGANLGLFALWVLRDWQPAAARVVAFEPLPQLANVLEANLREHGLVDKVTIVRRGLHRRPGVLPFTFYPRMPGNSTAHPQEKWRHQLPAMAAGRGGAAGAQAFFLGSELVVCPVTTLAAFLQEEYGQQEVQWRHVCAAHQQQQGDRGQAERLLEQEQQGAGAGHPVIDLLKVDVEGCELEVLQGLDQQGWQAVRQVVAEVHCVGGRVEAVQSLLAAQGFSVACECHDEVPGAAMVYARRL